MIREHELITNETILLLDMPLSYGDMTDHISGASIVNNGKVTWDSNIGAYKFTQTGYGTSNTPYISGVYLPIYQNSVGRFGRSFDIYPISSQDSGGTVILLGHRSTTQNGQRNAYSCSFSISNTSSPAYMAKNTWHSVTIIRDETLDPSIIITVDGNSGGIVQDSYQSTFTNSVLLFACGMYSANSKVSFCLKNLKYWSL